MAGLALLLGRLCGRQGGHFLSLLQKSDHAVMMEMDGGGRGAVGVLEHYIYYSPFSCYCACPCGLCTHIHDTRFVSLLSLMYRAVDIPPFPPQ